jgi:hypothetical protein
LEVLLQPGHRAFHRTLLIVRREIASLAALAERRATASESESRPVARFRPLAAGRSEAEAPLGPELLAQLAIRD